MSSDSSLLLSIIVFVIVVVCSFAYTFLVKRASFLDPAVQFIFFFALFVLPLPIRAYQARDIEGDITENLRLIMPYLPKAVFLCALSLPFFLLAYYGTLARRIAVYLPIPRSGTHSRRAFVYLAAISLFLIALLAKDSGGILSFILLGYNSTAEIFGRGYLAVGFSWLVVAPMFLLHHYALKREKRDLVLFSAISVLLIAMYLLLGDRHTIVYGVLAVLLFWHHAIRPVSWKKLALFGALSFIVLNIIGQIRGSRYESLGDYWEKTSSAYNKGVEDSPSTMFYTLTTGEFVVPFETLPQMLMSVGGSVNPEFGLTYLKAPLFFIPSAIFPGRPASLTHWYMETFYGTGHGLNEGRAFFFLSEGYLNFGYIGVLLTMVAWGLFLGAARAYIERGRRSPGAALLYALTVAFIMRGLAGDFVSVFVGLPEQSLSAAIVGLWIANRGTTMHVSAPQNLS